MKKGKNIKKNKKGIKSFLYNNIFISFNFMSDYLTIIILTLLTILELFRFMPTVIGLCTIQTAHKQ